MASFFFWLLVIVLAIIAGVVFTFLFFGLTFLLRDMLFTKRGIPKDKTRVSEYTKDNPEKFEKTNPGEASKESKEEVKEHERKRNAKYREFEKLRRAENNRRKGSDNRDTKGSEQLQRSELLSDITDTGNESNIDSDIRNKRSVKLDG